MAYIYLVIAIAAEVIATSALKASNEFTKLTPSIIVIVGYSTSFYFLALTLRYLPIGIAYAFWSGLGIILVTLVGLFVYHQTPDIPALIGMGLIISGVVVINLFSSMTH